MQAHLPYGPLCSHLYQSHTHTHKQGCSCTHTHKRTGVHALCTQNYTPALEPATAPRTTVCVRIAYSRRLHALGGSGAAMLVCEDGEGAGGVPGLTASLAGLLSGGLDQHQALAAPRTTSQEGGLQALVAQDSPGPARDGDRVPDSGSQLVRGGAVTGMAGAGAGGVPGLFADGPALGGAGPAGERLYFVSDPQLRRARALFPCVDDTGQLAQYELWLSVPHDYVAVCGGALQGSTLVAAGEVSKCHGAAVVNKPSVKRLPLIVMDALQTCYALLGRGSVRGRAAGQMGQPVQGHMHTFTRVNACMHVGGCPGRRLACVITAWPVLSPPGLCYRRLACVIAAWPV